MEKKDACIFVTALSLGRNKYLKMSLSKASPLKHDTEGTYIHFTTQQFPQTCQIPL